MASLSGSFKPIRINETRSFTVKTRGLAAINIRCFVSPPTPPKFQECKECGEISDSVVSNGDLITIRPSSYMFENSDGGLILVIMDKWSSNTYRLYLHKDRDGEEEYLSEGF